MKSDVQRWSRLLGFISLLLFTLGCSQVYYDTMEKLGKHKRDLLRDNVEEVREEQQEASDQFKGALTRLQELTGGVADKDLEKAYNRLKKDYDRCEDRAEAVRDRIDKIDRIAKDLFDEWQGEIDSMSSTSLKSKSRDKLRATQKRYASLYRAMTRAEKRLQPVLVQFRDQVLYLKHNLNASAIAGLKGEVRTIETDVTALLTEMKKSIAESERFIAAMPN